MDWHLASPLALHDKICDNHRTNDFERVLDYLSESAHFVAKLKSTSESRAPRIGYGIAAHILHNCARLYLVGKKEEHLSEAQDSLQKYGDVSRVELVQCDLEDLQQTHEVAKKLASQLQRLDALILNAGLGVGPIIVMRTLLPLLIATPDSRLCFQSSEMHRLGTSGVEFRDVEKMKGDIGPTKLYSRTKLAQVLLCRELRRRKMRVSTDQPEQAVQAYGKLGRIGVKAVRPFMKEPVDEGCRSILFAAMSDDVVKQQINGEYIAPDRKITSPSDQAQNEELQDRCWDLIEDILEQKLGVSY
ncbi:NAD(P)-binding protein [Xylaria sp. FL1042]|nr:NAD(P)-binding protein [Xylaria sp. FL1042]